MKALPPYHIYEQELLYMPYKESLRKVTEIVCSQTPKNGNLLDIMCGPGYLVGKIYEKREDIAILGVDIDKEYIKRAKEANPKANFEVGDVLS